MEKKQYISPLGFDFTEFVKTDEDIKMFEEMSESESRTKGVRLKDCIEDVVKALRLGRILKGGDPNTVVMAKTPTEGLAKLKAFSKANQN